LLFTDTGHIEWHLEVGLAMQFIEAPLQVQQRNTIPQGMYDSCSTIGQLSSGNAAGHQDDPLDLQGLPLGPFLQNLGWHSKGIGAMAGSVLNPFFFVYFKCCEPNRILFSLYFS
jgi:iron transport multicopper oxidase